MKPEELLYSLDQVGEDLLTATEQTIQVRRHRPWAGAAAAAALVVAAVGIGGALLWQSLRNTGATPGTEVQDPFGTADQPIVSTTQEPQAPISDPGPALEPLEAEVFLERNALLLQNPEDYVLSNPWRETDSFPTLPVYQVPEAAGGLGREAMSALLDQTLSRLCATAERVPAWLSDETDTALHTSMLVETDRGSLLLESSGALTFLCADNYAPFPAGNYVGGQADEALLQAFGTHLITLGLYSSQTVWAPVEGKAAVEEPLLYLNTLVYSAELYPRIAETEPRQGLLLYSFARVRVYYRNGILLGFSLPAKLPQGVYDWQAAYDSETVPGSDDANYAEPGVQTLWDTIPCGSYPLITHREARTKAESWLSRLASRGMDLSLLGLGSEGSLPADTAVELVYRADASGSRLLPWYRFLLPTGRDDGTDGAVTCAVLWVPAVNDMFLTTPETDPPEPDDPSEQLLPDDDTSWSLVGTRFDLLIGRVLYQSQTGQSQCYYNHWHALIWEDTLGDGGPYPMLYAAVSSDRETVTGMVRYEPQEDGTLGCGCLGLQAIDPVTDPASLVGMTEEALIQRFGPCHFDLGGEAYIPCWFTRDARLLIVHCDERVTSAEVKALGELQALDSDGPALSDLASDRLGPKTDLGIGIRILRNDEEMVVFYNHLGLWCFDGTTRELRFAVDLDKALDRHGNVQIQGDGPCTWGVISAQGDRVLLVYEDPEGISDYCLIDLVFGTYQKLAAYPDAAVFTHADPEKVEALNHFTWGWGESSVALSDLWIVSDGETWYPFG